MLPQKPFSLSSLRNTVIVLAAFVVADAVQAKKVDIKWGVITGAEKYEYELSRSDKFLGEMIRSGSTKNLYFVTDLGPGVYFLRVRGVDNASRSGAWSQGTRIVVEANSLELLRPQAGETIELVAEDASFAVEWAAVEGAEDYQVLVRYGSDLRNIISPTNSLRIDGLKAGIWTVGIKARVAGQAVQKSKEISFKVLINPKPKPVIYSPISGESTIAWDHFSVRWLNNSIAPKSEVTIRRMGEGSGIVSREVVYGRAETFTPKLPPGAFQISVRNIYDTMTSEAAVVDITTKEDPMGYHPQYFGITGNLVLGPTLGTTGFKNAGYDSDSHKGIGGSGEFEFRLTGELYNRWGMELGAGARGDRFTDQLGIVGSDDTFVNIKSTRVQPNIFAGVRYRLEPLGPSKPIWLRAWLFWRQVEMPIGEKGIEDGLTTSGGAPGFKISNSRIWGTGLGAEMRWGGYRSRWDVNGRADLLVPWIARGLTLGTGGVGQIWPTLELRIIPRVIVSSNVKLGLVTGLRVESLTLKEQDQENSKLYSVRVFLMPTLAWDF